MQSSTLVRNLRFTGLVIGFIIFAFTLVRWIEYNANIQAVQHGPLVARATTQ